MGTKVKDIKSRKAAYEREAVARGTLRGARISPQKMRLVLNLIRGKQVDPALQQLRYTPKKGAKLVEKLLRSAIANAGNKRGVDIDKLWITGAWADMGPSLHRHMPRAQGRATPIVKRTSKITLLLGYR